MIYLAETEIVDSEVETKTEDTENTETEVETETKKDDKKDDKKEPEKKVAKKRGRPRKKNKKHADIKKICITCLEEKKLNSFYKSNNTLHGDGYVPICSSCIKEYCYDFSSDDINIEKFKKILRQLDRPFIQKYYDTATEQYYRIYSGNEVPKGSKLNVIGYYFKFLSAFNQLKMLNWDDGVRVENGESEAQVYKGKNVFTLKKESEAAGESSGAFNNDIIIEMPTDGEIIDNKLMQMFGEGYTPKEYEAMEQKYLFLLESYPSSTNLHIEALINYVRLKVKAEFAIAEGNVSEAKSWDEMAQKAADKAKINPSQFSAKDLQGGLDSFSKVFQAIEQEKDIIPILPEFKYRPNDAPDFIIWCYVNYIRRLEGKPDCEYEEVYKFYDEKKNEYIEQYGDPYGIFSNDTTENNRNKISQFIDIPQDEEV